ncbi:MAG: beta-galactosidase [Anaerolineae bacterium]
MHSITYDSHSFIADGKRLFLYSGEMHYFRTETQQWHASLAKMQEAGLNALSLYVPWNWHEPVEGMLDFTGQTHPKRNLVRFLELVHQQDLFVILRPGPYICSEWLNGGIPTWLLEQHPEILALNSLGQPSIRAGFRYPPITYSHPTYLHYVQKWYRDLFRVVRPFLCANGGKIINIQLDDEQSYWWTLVEGPLASDYNPVVIGGAGFENRFGHWLERKYQSDIGALNRAYRAHYQDFACVAPPYSPPESYRSLPLYLDWYWFKLSMIDEYIQHLYAMLIQEGVQESVSTLCHYLFAPMAWSKFTAFIREEGLKIILTNQYYSGSLQGTSDMREDKVGSLVANLEIYKTAIKEVRTPPILMEIQSAMYAHITAPEMEELYRLCLAQGIKGLNFYMMVGGENHPDYVLTTGRSYDISCPIGHQGQIRDHYYTIRDLGLAFQLGKETLIAAETLYDIAVGFYEPYEACSYQGNTLDLGFRDDYRSLFDECFNYFICKPQGNDLFTLLTLSGVSFKMLDLERTSLEELLQIKQLWVLGLDFMAREVQEKLRQYVQQGGCLVLFPRIPTLDESMQPCSILQEIFECAPLEPQQLAWRPSQHLKFGAINFGQRYGILVHDYIDRFDPPADAQVIATESKSHKACAFYRLVGKGKGILIGFKPKYIWDALLDHKAFIHTILEVGGVKRCAYSETDELIVKECVAGEQGFLVVVNPVNWVNSSGIIYTDPTTRRQARLPYLRPELTYTRQGGTIMMLGRDLLPTLDGRLIYCTAEIIRWEHAQGGVEMVIREEKSSYAELAVQAEEPLIAYVEDRLVDLCHDETVNITYIPVQLPHPTSRIRLARLLR